MSQPSLPAVQACPDCGRSTPFSHPQTTVAVCGCGAVLHRKGAALLVKPFLRIPDAGDLIQPGSTGVWQQKPFSVLGRLRVWVSEAVVNYWTIAFDNGGLAYLLEGYGMYAVCGKLPEDACPAIDPQQLYTGCQRKLKENESYLLERKDQCFRWEIEGELLLPDCNNQFTILNFTSERGEHLQVIAFLKTKQEAYQVVYTRFDALQLDRLQLQAPVAKQWLCEQCQGTISVMAYPYSQSLVCPHCKACYVLKQNGVYQLQRTRMTMTVTPDLEPGASGKIMGILYQVIGATVREERSSEQAQWREYTLYNRQEGYAFLSEYNGHWVYARQQGDTPVLIKDDVTTFTYEAEPFQLFNSYHFKVVFAVGEFANNLFNDHKKFVREFISPPEMWIREQSAEEGIEWFLGQHISGWELDNAFGEKIVRPHQEGIGVVQPVGYINLQRRVLVFLLGVLALLLVHLATTMGNREQLLMNRVFRFADTATTMSEVPGTVVLKKHNANIEVEMKAPLNNSWAESDVSLVNEKTGEMLNINMGVEHYYGYSDGESWTEGSPYATAYFSGVPAGNYRIQVDGVREAPGYLSGGVSSFSIKMIYDVPNQRNVFICICLLLIWPVLHHYIVQYNEKKRWSNSPLNPYTHEN